MLAVTARKRKDGVLASSFALCSQLLITIVIRSSWKLEGEFLERSKIGLSALDSALELVNGCLWQ